jgi:hypothetical protein
MGVLGAPLQPSGAIKKHLHVHELHIYLKMVGSPVLIVLTMGSLHTKPPQYDFLNLYGACLHAPRTPALQSISVSIAHSGAHYLVSDCSDWVGAGAYRSLARPRGGLK